MWAAFRVFTLRVLFASGAACGLGAGVEGGLFLGASGGCHRHAPSEKLQVAATIFPVYDLTRRVAGEDAHVALLVPAGQGEHPFEPGANEVAKVAHVQLGIMVGLGFDTWMERLMREYAPKGRILKLGDRVPTLPARVPSLATDGTEHAPPDPYVWLDPTRAQLMVKAISEDLSRADPAHASAYRTRAAEVEQSLDLADRETEARISKWSEKGFVPFHATFAYFADRYQLQILDVVEPSSGVVPAEGHTQALVRLVAEKKLRAIFAEPQSNLGPAQKITEATQVSLGMLDPVGGTTTATDSYEKMMRFNVQSLESALR